MQYQGERVAQFNPLQQQSFTGIAGMQAAPQLGQATAGLNTAMQGAYGTNYNYDPYQAQQIDPNQLQNYQMGPAERVGTQSFAQPGAADAYMNPYMQSVVDIQKREAQRQSGIQGTQQQAQAAQAGAFGGGRDAVMRAERERNLAQQMGDIQATGSNAAYQQAQQQFNAEQQARLQAQQANQQAGITVGSQNLGANLGVQQLGQQAKTANQAAALNAAQLNAQQGQFGANLGLQGLQTGISAANALAGVGQNQYQQNMGINQLQNQYGGQMQQQAQNVLNNQYENFQNAQNYPYQQMNFMSNLVRGLPMTNQTSQVYQAPPSTLSQVAGLGGALISGAKLFGLAGGGSVGYGSGLADLALHHMGQE